MLFVCDHYRFYELKDKVKSSAYLAASMIQQIGNTKSDKQLKKNELVRITYASCLNFFHTNSMFKPWPLGIYYRVNYYYVKRINQDSYQYQHCNSSTGNTTEVNNNLFNRMNINVNSIDTKTLNDVEKIHQDLICNKDGDERLLIQAFYNATALTNFTKSKLGLFIMEPKFGEFGDNGNFVYKLIIIPKPGLFPVKNE